MFRSPSVKIHFARGIAGLGLLALALNYSHALGWWTAIPALGALFAFGGCPMCWIVGLVDTFLGGESAPLCLTCVTSESDNRPTSYPPAGPDTPA